MNEDRKILAESQKTEHYEDEIELIDYLLVIWKWKYIIIAGTLVFGVTAAIISFIPLKQQPILYRTSVVLKPGILEIDEKGVKVFIDTPQNIKALIENELKYKIPEEIENSNNTKLSTAPDFRIDIIKDSNIINISLIYSSPDEGSVKLNYLIKALISEYDYKIEYMQNKIDEQIEQKETLLASLKEKEIMPVMNIEDNIKLKNYELDKLSTKEKSIKAKIENYRQAMSEIEAKIKLLNDNKDISQNKEYFLKKLSLENDYRNNFQKYFELNENEKYNLFELQKKKIKVSDEIESLIKIRSKIKPNPYYHNIQKNIIEITKGIETLEKKKSDIQLIKIVQQPLTTKIAPIKPKIIQKIILATIIGVFSMVFLAFFGEYISRYRYRRSR